MLITCEHGGNHIPLEFTGIFRNHKKVLKTHSGYDPGAHDLSKMIARRFNAPFHASMISRLLVDLNRSPSSPRLMSKISKALSPSIRARILERYYQPYRTAVESSISESIYRGNRVLHFSVHSFSPSYNGKVRNADIGFLYDPSCKDEQRFCRLLQKAILRRHPEVCIRLNYPYRGIADGLTTSMRKRYPGKDYLGIELEVNQKHPLGNRKKWVQLKRYIVDGIDVAIDELVSTG